jgi:hypothetical protein
VPTPTPVPATSTYYFLVDACDGSAGGYTQIASTVILTSGQAVLMPDGKCYEYTGGVGTINSNTYSQLFNSCEICNPPTPTPTPTPAPTPTPVPVPTPTPVPSASCNALVLHRDTSELAVCTARTGTQYLNTNDLCTATVYYGTTPGCTTVYTSTIYLSDGIYTRLWNGSTQQFDTLCTPCI